jgi:hypothetical protein
VELSVWLLHWQVGPSSLASNYVLTGSQLQIWIRILLNVCRFCSNIDHLYYLLIFDEIWIFTLLSIWCNFCECLIEIG